MNVPGTSSQHSACLASTSWHAHAGIAVRTGINAAATAAGLSSWEKSPAPETGRDPYQTLMPQLVEAWIAWASEFVAGPPARRRAEAEAAIAILDGLLLLRQLAGPKAADRAARILGLTGPQR